MEAVALEKSHSRLSGSGFLGQMVWWKLRRTITKTAPLLPHLVGRAHICMKVGAIGTLRGTYPESLAFCRWGARSDNSNAGNEMEKQENRTVQSLICSCEQSGAPRLSSSPGIAEKYAS
jgi:hypothetical protein